MNLKRINAKIITFFILLFVLFAINSCKDKDDIVPYAYVNFYVYINEPDFFELNAIGNSVTVTGGVSGIIIYRASENSFKAYDRTCTYKPSDPCEVIELYEQGSPLAIDSCCGSKFLLTDGSVLEGPALLNLREYNANFDGNAIHIYN